MIDLAALKAFVIARLQESSTWRGLILIATAGFGWQVPPERQEAIVLGGLLLAGMVAVAFPDRRAPRPPRAPDDGQESGV
jgi:hypothetical protein